MITPWTAVDALIAGACAATPMQISLVTLARGAILLWLLLWATTTGAQPAQRSSFNVDNERSTLLERGP